MEAKHLGYLNTSNYFCKGCGITNAASVDECEVCTNLAVNAEPSLWRAVKIEAIAVLIVLLAFIALFTYALV